MPAATPTAASPVRTSVTTGGVTLLAANAARSGYVIYNEGASEIYLKFGAAATTTTYTVRIPMGATYESMPLAVYQGIITACTASGTATPNVTEFTG